MTQSSLQVRLYSHRRWVGVVDKDASKEKSTYFRELRHCRKEGRVEE